MSLIDNITGKQALINRNQLLENNFQLFKKAFRNLKEEAQALRDTNKELIRSNELLDKSHKDLIRTHRDLIEESDKLREEVRTLLYEITLLKDEQKESHKEVMDGIHELKEKDKPLETIDCRGLSLLKHPAMPTLMAGVEDVVITEDDLIHARKIYEDGLKPYPPEIDEQMSIEEKEILSEFERNETETLPKYIEEIISNQDTNNVNQENQSKKTPERIIDEPNHTITPEIPKNDHEDGFKSPEIGEITEPTKKGEIIEKVNHEDSITATNEPAPIQNDLTKLSPTKRKIVKYIVNNAGCRNADIASGLKINASTISNHMKELCELKYVRRDDEKRYSVI